MRDHLGNIRVTFKDKNNDGAINYWSPSTSPDNEISQINHYYPFGLNMEGNWNGQNGANKYQYNGKELNTDFDLGWNDYGARFYDAASGRWNAVDPLSEEYLSTSSYSYGMNNPIKFIDPDGMQTEDWVKNKKTGGLEWDAKVKSQGDIKDSGTYEYFGAAGKEYESSEGWIRLGEGAGNWSIVDKPTAQREAEALKFENDFKAGIKDRELLFTFCKGYCVVAAGFLVPGSGAANVSFRGSIALKNAIELTPKVVGKGVIIEKGITVLGHYPQYIELAGQIGAKTFQIPTKFWNMMTEAEQWLANVKYLDRMILRGDKIRLATPLNQVKSGSFLEKELKYLFEKGYQISSDGLWLTK